MYAIFTPKQIGELITCKFLNHARLLLSHRTVAGRGGGGDVLEMIDHKVKRFRVRRENVCRVHFVPYKDVIASPNPTTTLTVGHRGLSPPPLLNVTPFSSHLQPISLFPSDFTIKLAFYSTSRYPLPHHTKMHE